MITAPPLVDANPGDPITSERWNNVLQALRTIYEAMNKNIGSLVVQVRNQADGNPIRGATVTLIPTGDTTRPVRASLFAGGGVNQYQVSQLLAGAYNVVVEAPGFNTETRPITMPPDGSSQQLAVPMTVAEALSSMPNLFGMTLKRAIEAVTTREFQVIRIIDSHGKDIPPGAVPADAVDAMVLGQVPDPGTDIARNTPIQIHISAKAEYAERIKVPDLRGLTLEEAKAKLASVHLVLGETVTVRSPAKPLSATPVEEV